MSNIPFKSACLVSHHPDGALPIASDSGKISSNLKHDLDYAGREGQFQEKGGCDIELTRADRELISRSLDLEFEPEEGGLSEELLRHMDYTERTGRFAEKGAGLMEDCRHWGPNGPVSRVDLEADMLACGGHYMKSIVTIDRNYAAELGIDSKEAFQRLLRATWVDSVMKWGVPKLQNKTDVHWVAEYHTDAPHSIHVHIDTWFSPDIDVEEGWTVSAANTRIAKQEIYRDAYAIPRFEQDRERDYTRQLLPAIARTELGREVSDTTIQRLQEKADMLGIEFSLERTVEEGALDSQIERLRELYAQGEGRIANNYKLEAAARDICDRLYKTSEPYRQAWDSYRQMIEDKADMAGLAVHVPKNPEADEYFEPEELSKAQEITQHLRDHMIREEMDDIKHRISSQIIRSLDPTRERDAVLRELSKEITRGHTLDALYHPERLGISREDSERVVREVSQARLDRALSPEVSQQLADAYTRASVFDGESVRFDEKAAELERIVVSEISSASGIDPEQAREMLREHAGEDLSQVFSIERSEMFAADSVDKAARTLTQLLMESREMENRISQAIEREDAFLEKYSLDSDQARQLLRESVERTVEFSTRISVSNFHADPESTVKTDVSREILRNIDHQRSLYSLAMEDRGLALQISPDSYEILYESVRTMRELCTQDLSQEEVARDYERAAQQAAAIIVMSPRVQEIIDGYAQSYASLTGRDADQMREHLTAVAAQRVENSLHSRVEYDNQNGRPMVREQEQNNDYDRGGLLADFGMNMAELASQLVQAVARASRGGQAYNRRRYNENEREERYVDQAREY